MRQLIQPLILVLIACGAVFGTLVFAEMKRSPEDRPLGDVVASVFGDIGSAMAANKPNPTYNLPDFLPEAGQGWTRSDYVKPDSIDITGEPYRETLIAISTNNDITTNFVHAAVRSRNQAVVQTYRNGTGVVIMMVKFVPPSDMESPGFVMGERLRGNGAYRPTPGSIIVAPGVLFRKLAQTNRIHSRGTETPVDYHRYEAGIGRQVTIEVVSSQVDDAALAELFGRIDLAGLHGINEAPDPMFGEPILAMRDQPVTGDAETMAVLALGDAIGAGLQLEANGLDGLFAATDADAATQAAVEAAMDAALADLVANGALTEEAAAQAAEVTVQRGLSTRGGTTCVIENGVRRCRIGN